MMCVFHRQSKRQYCAFWSGMGWEIHLTARRLDNSSPNNAHLIHQYFLSRFDMVAFDRNVLEKKTEKYITLY